jgi:hypothetical protein
MGWGNTLTYNSTFIIENSVESGKTKGWKTLETRTETPDKIKSHI